MSTVRVRNVSPLGHLDVAEIGREGPAPHFGFCETCTADPTSDHEHELVKPDELAGEGEGCLKPGEVFEVDDKVAKKLLAQVGNFELAEPKKAAAKKAEPKGGESA